MRALRLVTYNVRGCRGADGRHDPLRTAHVIANLSPDVVALQELDVLRTRSGVEHQPRRIAEALEMKFHFSAALVSGDERYGNAVLSRYPLQVVREAPLPRLWRTESRGALWVRIDVDGVEVQVIGTHLGLLLPERIIQAGALLGPAWLGDPRCRPPRILCGDFNSVPGSLPYRWINRALDDTAQRSGARFTLATYPASVPLIRLDHVFASQDLRVQRALVPVRAPVRAASDHRPLVVDFVIRAGT